MPPKDRMNLTKNRNLIWKGRFTSKDEIGTAIISFKAKDDIYLISNFGYETHISKLSKKDELTFLAKTSKETNFFSTGIYKSIIIENEHIYYTSSNMDGYVGDSKKILKYDFVKNEITIIDTRLNYHIRWINKINGEYYIACKEEYDRYHFFKTQDFITFTEITSNIVYKTGSERTLYNFYCQIEIEEKVYTPHFIFDGKTLSEVSAEFKKNSEVFYTAFNKGYSSYYYKEFIILFNRNSNSYNDNNKIQIFKITKNGVFKVAEEFDVLYTTNLILDCDNYGNVSYLSNEHDLFHFKDYYKEI